MLFPDTLELAAALTPARWSLDFLAVLGFGIALSFVFRTISGWSALAQVYRVDVPFRGKRYWFCNGSMNMVSYNRIMILGADETGFSLALMFPFNFAGTPLLIPWEDVTVTPTKVFLFPHLEFRFRQVPSVVLKVSERLGRKLLSARPEEQTQFGA